MKTFEEWFNDSLCAAIMDYGESAFRYSDLNDAWNFATEQAKPRWIPISERLPEKHKKVLYRNNKIEPTTMIYQNVPFSRFINQDSGKWYFTDDSEWMELPE